MARALEQREKAASVTFPSLLNRPCCCNGSYSTKASVGVCINLFASSMDSYLYACQMMP